MLWCGRCGCVPCRRKELDVEVGEQGECGGVRLVCTVSRVVHQFDDWQCKIIGRRQDVGYVSQVSVHQTEIEIRLLHAQSMIGASFLSKPAGTCVATVSSSSNPSNTESLSVRSLRTSTSTARLCCNAQLRAGAFSGDSLVYVVDRDTGNLPDPDRYEGTSAGGALSRLNGTSKEMTGMSILDSRLDANEIGQRYKRQIQYRYSPSNRRIDLRRLFALEIQDDTTNS